MIIGCVTIVKSAWKHESGYRVGDFIDFKSNVYVLREGYIYQNDKKVARVIDTEFRLVGNHKLIIQSITTNELGVYTAN